MPSRYRFDGELVRKERKRHGWSLEELAAKIGVTTPFLGQIELGKRKPSLETFERLVSVFDSTPEALMKGSGQLEELPLESRIAAVLKGQPEESQRALLDTLRFLSKRLFAARRGRQSKRGPAPLSSTRPQRE